MENKDFDVAIKKFEKAGLSLNAINLALSALEKGYTEIADFLTAPITKDDLEQLISIFDEFYFASDNSSERTNIIKSFVNKGLPLECLKTTDYPNEVLATISYDLNNGKDVSCYTTLAKDRLIDKRAIDCIRSLRDLNFLNNLSDEQKSLVTTFPVSVLEGLIPQTGKDTSPSASLQPDTFAPFLDFIKDTEFDEENFFYSNTDKVRQIIKSFNLKVVFAGLDDLIPFENFSVGSLRNLESTLLEHKDKLNKLYFYKDYIKGKALAPQYYQILLVQPENEIFGKILTYDFLDGSNQQKIVLAYLKENKSPLLDKVVEFDVRHKTNAFLFSELKNLETRFDKNTIDDFLECLDKEFDYNERVNRNDFYFILQAYNLGLDMSQILSNEEVVRDKYDKEFLIEVQLFNQKYPENKIDLKELNILEDEHSYFDIDGSLICFYTELLKADADFRPLIDVDNDTINEVFYENEDEFKKILEDSDKLKTFLTYFEIPDIEVSTLTELMILLNKGYKLLDDNAIRIEAISAKQEYDKLASFDKFSKHVIDDVLNEENCFEITNKLKLYQSLTGLEQDIQKATIEDNLDTNVAFKNKFISNAIKNQAYEDLQNGLNPVYYLNRTGTDEIKLLYRQIYLKTKDTTLFDSQKQAINRFLNTDIDFPHRKETLDFLIDKLNEFYVNTDYLKFAYFDMTPEMIELYVAWDNFIYKAFDKELKSLDSNVDRTAARYVYNAFQKLDHVLSYEEQLEAFNRSKKEGLEKALVYCDEHNCSLDVKLRINTLLKELEDKSNNAKFKEMEK